MMIADRKTRLTHSVPRASGRVAHSPWGPGASGPQKMRFATRST